MNNNEKPSLKSKGMSVAIVICFVVVVSVVGAVVYNSYHRRATGSQLALQKRPEQPIPMILFCRRPKKIHPQKMDQRQVRMKAQRHRQRQQHRQNKFILMKTVHLHGRQVEV